MSHQQYNDEQSDHADHHALDKSTDNGLQVLLFFLSVRSLIFVFLSVKLIVIHNISYCSFFTLQHAT